MQTAGIPYPASLTFSPPGRVANWRPVVQGFLAIPHFIVLWALGIGAGCAAVAAWFSILFTGRLPAGIANYQAMYLRYTARVMSYALWQRDDYPPFSFQMTAADPGDYTGLRVDVDPQLTNRNRVTAFFRYLLAIPHMIALMFVTVGVYVVAFIAWFAVLFTGRWPAGMQAFTIGVGRWFVRANAYTLLLTDDYPPFTTE